MCFWLIIWKQAYSSGKPPPARRNLQVTTWLFRIAFGLFRFHINYPPLWQRSRFSAHGIRIWRAWSKSAKTPWALSPRRLRTWSNTQLLPPRITSQRIFFRMPAIHNACWRTSEAWSGSSADQWCFGTSWTPLWCCWPCSVPVSDLKVISNTKENEEDYELTNANDIISTERRHLPEPLCLLFWRATCHLGISRSSAMDLLMKRYHGVCQNAVPKGSSKD